MGWSSVLTVTSAAASGDLITLAEFKEDHGITVATHDTLLGRLITRASLTIARETGRVFPQETISEVFQVEKETWDSPIVPGLPELTLGRWPIISVTSVAEGDETLLAAEYTVDKPTGLLRRFNEDAIPKQKLWAATRVTVVYVAGFATIPDDLAEAVSLLAWDRFQSRTRDRDVQSKFVDGVDRVEYFKPSETAFPLEVQAIIDAYRVPVFR